MSVRAADRLHACLMLLAAAVTAVYWALYFSTGATQSRQDPVYLGFESAFPLADGLMAIAFVISAVLLLRQRPRAIFWGMAAGSAMIYLAGLDLLFDLEQHLFAPPLNDEAWGEAAINVCCWLLGPVTLARLWHHPLRKS